MNKLLLIVRFLWMQVYVRGLNVYEKVFEPHWHITHRMPSPLMRYRVSGTSDKLFYLDAGRSMWSETLHQIRTHARQSMIDSDKGTASTLRILDYGCGCGRVARHIVPESIKYMGVDIDDIAVEWCKEHLGHIGHFDNISAMSAIPDGALDAIMSVSVFTRIDFDVQEELITEFFRMLKVGGIIVLSIHGTYAAHKNLNPSDFQTFLKEGRLFKKSKFMSSYFSSAFCGADMEFLNAFDYIPCGLGGWQDIVVMKKVKE